MGRPRGESAGSVAQRHAHTPNVGKCHGRARGLLVIVDCGNGTPGQGPLAVVPLLDGDRIAGFEIRCGCGATAVVECVYPTETRQ